MNARKFSNATPVFIATRMMPRELKRLDKLVKKSGRSRANYILKVLQAHITQAEAQ